MDSRFLYIPVLLGTSRKGRMSAYVGRLLAAEVAKQPGVETDLIDICSLPLPTDDAGEAIKDGGFSSKMDRADGLVIIAPEYNHGYCGLLKHVLDSCLKEYIHKAVGVVGVSAGPFGGTRVIQNMLPVMRELGLVTIFWDVNFSAVQNCFDADGELLDSSYIRRTDKFLKELLWMSRTLRQGREDIVVHCAQRNASRPNMPENMKCPRCGAEMNYHADKLLASDSESNSKGTVMELHSCPACGSSASRCVPA